MINDNAKNTALFSTITILAMSVVFISAFAEESKYNMAGNVETIVTFHFRDGVEVHKIPVFEMGENYVNNRSPSFTLKGVINEAPHLHQALDEAYRYHQSFDFQWNYKEFDVIIDFIREGEALQQLFYKNCRINQYQIETLNDDYESYTSDSSGFVIIDEVEFICGGLKPLSNNSNTVSNNATIYSSDYGNHPFGVDNDTRAYVIFEFDNGIEKINFPSFALNSGYGKSSTGKIPAFSVEGLVSKHPLLTQAIENARYMQGMRQGTNLDFSANVQFMSGDDLIRGLDFDDCRVDTYTINTLYDNEEGFTGKRGFANVEQIGIICNGLSGINPYYEKLIQSSENNIENILSVHEYPMGTGPHAIATFTSGNGIEVIDFPIFSNNNIEKRLTSITPQFTLEGPIVHSSLLYDNADQSLEMGNTSGTSDNFERFQVDVDFVYGDKTIRSLNYQGCRVTDYVIETQRAGEENYFKAFPLTNAFTFECKGYHPKNPVYDAMFIKEKADTLSSLDLKVPEVVNSGFVDSTIDAAQNTKQ